MEKENKVDYLEVDDSINGQNYVCLSFISPESLIQNKEAFQTAKFLQSIAHEKEKDFKYFYNLYLDYTYKYSEKLQNDFDKENDFKNNIRGVKVRGVYQTEKEARNKAKILQSKDSTFNIFVGQVGHWLPWEPCADKVSDEVFMNEQLNEMVEKYKENEVNKDMLYESEKRDKMKLNMENKMKENQEQTNNVDDSIQGSDPWMKNNLESVESVDPVEPVESVESVESVDPVESVESVDPVEPVESVESVDPVEPVDPVDPVESIESVESVESVE